LHEAMPQSGFGHLLPPQHSAIDGLQTGSGTVGRRGAGSEYAMPGVHVNKDTLNALQVTRSVCLFVFLCLCGRWQQETGSGGA